MPCCCVKTLNLCNTSVCGTLELDKVAVMESGGDSTYRLVLDFLETEITIEQMQTEGENIFFPVTGLNENFQYTGKVYDGAGQLVEFQDGDQTYDCIKFKTIQGLNGNSPAAASSEDDTVTVEVFIGGIASIQGTQADVLGLDEGSTEITCIAFAGKLVEVHKGAIILPSFDPGNGDSFYTKDIASSTIILDKPLVAGEFIKIKTL